MSGTIDHERPPDAVITSSCRFEEGSLADIDRDGTDDVVLRSGGHVFSWPSSRGIGAPLVWSWDHAGEPSWFEVSTPNTGRPRVTWWAVDPKAAYEYEVEPASLALDVVEAFDFGRALHYVGDVDGDGAADNFAVYIGHDLPFSVRASSTGAYIPIPGWGFSDYEPWPYEYSPWSVWSVGDMNRDGYDDVLVTQRDWENEELSLDYTDSRSWGPAQLYLGSPAGIRTEPLWTLFAPDDALAGVGRGVAALPDEGTIVVTVVREGLFYVDFSSQRLGVIRDADTPDAYFEELVNVPELNPGGFTPYLQGWLDDGTGRRALAMIEAEGTTGIQWFPWSAGGEGFSAKADGTAVPSASWAPPEGKYLDGYLSPLAFPVGRHHQAVLLGLLDVDPDADYQLLVWGRRPAEIGIPDGGVTVEGCTFSVSVDGTSASWDTGVERPATPPASRGCGCDDGRGPVALAWLLGPLCFVRRRARRTARVERP